MQQKTRSIIWVALNIAGMALYLHLATALWPPLTEKCWEQGPGDAFYWLFALVPILGIFLLLNFFVLVAIIRRIRRKGSKSPLYIWIMLALLWLGVVGYDNYRVGHAYGNEEACGSAITNGA